MEELQKIILDTADRLFADHISSDLLRQCEAGHSPTVLWQAIFDSGLHKILCSEASGGTGGGWSDAYLVIKCAGRHAVPLPLADVIAAHWLADLCGFEVPENAVLVWAPAHLQKGKLILSPLPAQDLVTHVIAWDERGKTLSLFELNCIDIDRRTNIAGEACSHGSVDPKLVMSSAALNTDNLGHLSAQGLGALLRAGEMAGALEGALGLAVEYANDRVQFGRPIGKFQAIQQQLAMMSGYVAMANRAALAAYQNPCCPSGIFDIACAKTIAGDAAGIAGSVAHQVHGAIGITYEYQLQFLTRRLWSWRAEFGSETYWSKVIGESVLNEGADALWPMITANSHSITAP